MSVNIRMGNTPGWQVLWPVSDGGTHLLLRGVQTIISLALETLATLAAGLAALDRPLKALGAATGALATVKEAIVVSG